VEKLCLSPPTLLIAMYRIQHQMRRWSQHHHAHHDSPGQPRRRRRWSIHHSQVEVAQVVHAPHEFLLPESFAFQAPRRLEDQHRESRHHAKEQQKKQQQHVAMQDVLDVPRPRAPVPSRDSPPTEWTVARPRVIDAHAHEAPPVAMEQDIRYQEIRPVRSRKVRACVFVCVCVCVCLCVCVCVLISYAFLSSQADPGGRAQRRQRG
jgi:hypothetical protein